MSPNPIPRCPLCGLILIYLPVAGKTGIHAVCPHHPPKGACVRCGVLAGEAYAEPLLIAGRCSSCRNLTAARKGGD